MTEQQYEKAKKLKISKRQCEDEIEKLETEQKRANRTRIEYPDAPITVSLLRGNHVYLYYYQYAALLKLQIDKYKKELKRIEEDFKLL